jgi:hypothetical protein
LEAPLAAAGGEAGFDALAAGDRRGPRVAVDAEHVEALVTTAEAERTSGPERAESSDAAAAAMAPWLLYCAR